jgi:hypothetical protein
VPSGFAAEENLAVDGIDPARERCNTAYCDVLRLSKAAAAAAITAGTELAAIERKLGDQFDAFVERQLPLTPAEAHALIHFAADVGLQPDGLSPVIAVPLGRVLSAMALLGGLYLDEQEQRKSVARGGAGARQDGTADGCEAGSDVDEP